MNIRDKNKSPKMADLRSECIPEIISGERGRRAERLGWLAKCAGLSPSLNNINALYNKLPGRSSMRQTLTSNAQHFVSRHHSFN